MQNACREGARYGTGHQTDDNGNRILPHLNGYFDKNLVTVGGGTQGPNYAIYGASVKLVY